MHTIAITDLPRMERYKVRLAWKTGRIVYAQLHEGRWRLMRTVLSEDQKRQFAAEGWRQVAEQ